jgi:hypothetical protein
MLRFPDHSLPKLYVSFCYHSILKEFDKLHVNDGHQAVSSGSNADYSDSDFGGNVFCSRFVRISNKVRSFIAATPARQVDIPAASASKPGVEGVPDPLPQQVIA